MEKAVLGYTYKGIYLQIVLEVEKLRFRRIPIIIIFHIEADLVGVNFKEITSDGCLRKSTE